MDTICLPLKRNASTFVLLKTSEVPFSVLINLKVHLIFTLDHGISLVSTPTHSSSIVFGTFLKNAYYKKAWHLFCFSKPIVSGVVQIFSVGIGFMNKIFLSNE